MKRAIVIFAWIALANINFFVSSQDCVRQIHINKGANGLINSPNYPNDYPGNSNCIYTLISTSSGNHITINFVAFQLEAHRSCSFDYVEVFDGANTQAKSLGRHCGASLPPSYSSSGKYMTIRFKADDSVHGDGFSIGYRAGCTQQYETTSGQFASPNYPSNYPKEVDCTYVVLPHTGNQFLLSFTHFDVEESTNCEFDRVSLSTQEGGSDIGRYCGTKGTFRKLVNSSRIFLNFVSDRSVERNGFQLNYKVSTNCSVDNGGCSDHCRVIQPGKVLCTCDPGYRIDENGVRCVDIDECSDSPCGDVCTNSDGSFQCSCATTGFQLSPDGTTCTDMTCKIRNGGCAQLCQPFGNAQYHCACHKGFILAPDAHNCSDIDECTTTNQAFRHHCEQLCYNEAGSYYCDCNDGYKLSSNGRTCEDVDECPEQGEACDHKCVNVPSGWECACYEGYEVSPGNPHQCSDIDECERDLYPSACTHCVNNHGSYSCVCGSGFLANEDNSDCIDIDECLDNNGGCQQVCLNTPGSYSCVCLAGYAAVTNDSSSCGDINECALAPDGRGPCDQHCENAPGSFSCACAGGYILLESGLQCQDIDECQDKKRSDCQQDCKNTPGSFSCNCFVGYSEQDGVCTDIDECQNQPCDQNVESGCSNSQGSFMCECPPGYVVTNVTQCTDVDECATTEHGCMQLCVNDPGTFHCSCEKGFTQVDDKTCTDINECSRNPCVQSCVNMIGSFRCECHPGHFLLADGFNCSDVNECTEATHNCEQVCVNHIGHFSCKCRDGFILNSDNRTCTDIDECASQTAGCSHSCVNTAGSFWCFCESGFHLGADNRTCVDINECLSNNGGCQHVCNNNNGSYYCGCDLGYTYNGTHGCSDIDECEVSQGLCNQTCTNFPGGYNCSCGPTFKLGANNHSCEHCPTCSDFQQLESDVAGLKLVSATVNQFRDEIRRLSTLVTALQTRVSHLEANLVLEPLPNAGDTPK